MIKVNGNDIFLNDVKVSFMREIYKVLELSDGVVVLTHGFLRSDELDERNVYFVNMDGSIKWQIEHLGLPKNAGYQGYTSISLDEQNNLRAFNFHGFDCKVDVQNGNILEKVFTK